MFAFDAVFKSGAISLDVLVLTVVKRRRTQVLVVNPMHLSVFLLGWRWIEVALFDRA